MFLLILFEFFFLDVIYICFGFLGVEDGISMGLFSVRGNMACMMIYDCLFFWA